MLSDYIEAYKVALAKGDKREMSRIERELGRLGMDAHTLATLVDDRHDRRSTPYERTRARVYSTGNKWAIENFNATH